MERFAFRKVTAIFRIDRLQEVEKALQDIRVGGVSVTRVKGYGEYADFFARDWMSQYARAEIFTSESKAKEIVEAILSAASTGTRGDGIVSVLPVETVLRIRTRSPATPEEI